MINEFIRNYINENIDLDYKKFQSKLVLNVDNIEGVRIPLLHKLAKSICSMEYMDDYLENPILNTYEEIMVYGLVLGYIKIPFSKLKIYLKKFIPFIDNWAVCDTVVSNLKIIKNNKDECLKFLNNYLKSSNEYDLRFSIVVLKCYYLDNLNLVFNLIDNIKSDYYYVNMAIAWLISCAYKIDSNKTMNYLENSNISSFVYKKSIQKIHELSLYKI